MRLPAGHPAREVITFNDFFTVDGCRDLVLHVREQQFTPSRSAEYLEQLDLEVLHLECPSATQVQFAERFPVPGRQLAKQFPPHQQHRANVIRRFSLVRHGGAL